MFGAMETLFLPSFPKRGELLQITLCLLFDFGTFISSITAMLQHLPAVHERGFLMIYKLSLETLKYSKCILIFHSNPVFVPAELFLPMAAVTPPSNLAGAPLTER